MNPVLDPKLQETQQAQLIAEKLRTPLTGQGDYLKGGHNQPGYGVPSGAAVDGSHAFEGSQGYYAPAGEKAFLEGVQIYKRFFEKFQKPGRAIRYVVKAGIGGQHTPFQAIANIFASHADKRSTLIGEYELGKNYEAALSAVVKERAIGWDQIAVIPSSKSGSTDETMLIFVELLNTLIQHSVPPGADPQTLSRFVFDILHDINFVKGLERPNKDLFKVDRERFGTDNLVDLIAQRAHQKNLFLTDQDIVTLFRRVLGHMVFETTNRPDQSRLAAFIQNSGLDKVLGDDAPGVIEMFDNVGGRWTGDLHMMAFLGFYDLDAKAYWSARHRGIEEVRKGTHDGYRLGWRILDQGIRHIALLVPDHLFWFGKCIEQNCNESLWQEGFPNLVAVQQSDWEFQARNYQKQAMRLVINLSSLSLSPEDFAMDEPAVRVRLASTSTLPEVTEVLADLFSTFYGMTNTIGTALIARAIKMQGHKAEDVDLNDLQNPATQIVQRNLFLRQPFVELGKKLLEERLTKLQAQESSQHGAIAAAEVDIHRRAEARELQTNIEQFDGKASLPDIVQRAATYAREKARKFVPIIYLEGPGFVDLRQHLTRLGVEWVMQGTGDQHISLQQVLAQPQGYLPFIISFVPEKLMPGLPAVGFAKGYLHNISPHMVRDYFAEATYNALTGPEANPDGLRARALFLRLVDSPDMHTQLRAAFDTLAR